MIIDDILENARWKGYDDFPSNNTWKNEYEKYLNYLKDKGWLDKYMPRIMKQNTRKRDEAFSEIFCAYYLERICGFSIDQLEPMGINNKKGEFILYVNKTSIFCEVKSPGWEAEIVKERGTNTSRLNLPKYASGEARFFDNSNAIRAALSKAYEKIPYDKPSLLIINDDLFFGILDEPKANEMPMSVYRSLFYEPLPSPPYSDTHQIGCFMSDKYKYLSGSLFLKKEHVVGASSVSYENMLLLNSYAINKLSDIVVDKISRANKK